MSNVLAEVERITAASTNFCLTGLEQDMAHLV